MTDQERHPDAISALLAEAADVVERGATLGRGLSLRRARAVCEALGVPTEDAWHVQEDAARRVIRVWVGRRPTGTELPAAATRIFCDVDRASSRRQAKALRRAAQTTDGRPGETVTRLVCPECGEPARPRPPTTWLPPWVGEQRYSHLDGEPLCPVMGPGGYVPAAAVPAPPDGRQFNEEDGDDHR